MMVGKTLTDDSFCLSVQSLLLPGTPFPREQVFRDVHIDDFAVVTVVEPRLHRGSIAHGASGRPVGRSWDANQEARWRRVGPIWGVHLDGQRGTLGFPMCRRAIFGSHHLHGAWLSVTREQEKRLLGAWGVGPLVLTGESLGSRKPCKPSGALLDELVLVSVLAPLYSANLHSLPLNELFAFDPSGSRVGAPLSEEPWRSLHRREDVRLDWGCRPSILCSLTRGWQLLGTPLRSFA